MKIAFDAVTSLCKFKDLDSLVFATKIVLRLEKVITDIEHLLFKGGASHFRGIIFTSFNPRESRELGRAKEYQDRALDIFLKKLGPGHVDVAKSYSSLLHCRLGDLNWAKKFHERALHNR